MYRSVIIVAGGKGLRMGSEIPKQFLLLCKKPVLMHTVEAFHNADDEIRIILVLPKDQQSYWKSLCKKFKFRIVHQVVDGGDTRFDSVKNGLKQIPENSLVGIHDGVRPLVSGQLIRSAYREAATKGAIFPVTPVTDTLRKKTGSGSLAVKRSEYMLVQTPQVFYSDVILQAYQQPYSDIFTDDISVVESAGIHSVFEIPGEPENIKITTPSDLVIADAIITNTRF